MNHHMKMFLMAGFALTATALMANIKPAHIFSDNMVLQREKPVTVWGWADPGENVSVTFAGQTASAKADTKGNWEVKLKPLAVSKTGSDLVLKGKNTVTLKNVVVGDVWLCSGQSNMEMSFGWGILDGNNVKKQANNYPLIRQIKINRITSNFPLTNTQGSRWNICSEKTLNGVTATGYFFALELFKELNIPIGIIDDNWSGCRIEPFTAPEGFRAVPQLKNISSNVDKLNPATEAGKKAYLDSLAKIKEWVPLAEASVKEGKYPSEAVPQLPSLQHIGNASAQYNAMIYPIVRFPIKGAIWYQGCSNGGEGVSYYHKMHALVKGWRELWKDDFPFYFVQLASFQAPTPNNPAGGNGWSRLREAQRASLDIPKSGMAVTIDIGDAKDIHPKNKQDVGKRLALWALAKDYAKKGIVYSGPLYKNMNVEGNKIRVSFDFADSGLMVGSKKGLAPTEKVANGKLNQFAIAGKDRKWYWADAVIDGKTVVVSNPNVKEPVAVRYAFSQNPDGCNLYNTEGLPASPFRSDNW